MIARYISRQEAAAERTISDQSSMQSSRNPVASRMALACPWFGKISPPEPMQIIIWNKAVIIFQLSIPPDINPVVLSELLILFVSVFRRHERPLGNRTHLIKEKL